MTTRSTNVQDAAWSIIRKLRSNGYVALLAGGCVRDRLLGLEPKDYDIATSASPDQVLALFRGARKVGAKFGVALVRRMGQDFEVATFRTDGPYTDGRHPDHVSFSTPQEDAKRRDFTINGLFMDTATGNILDYVGGQADLRAGVIRTIGAPADRFAEDNLRMLRAVRFAARFEFAIEQTTSEEIARQAPRLSQISPERIWLELSTILTDPSRKRGWDFLTELGLRAHLAASWAESADLDAIASRRLAGLPSSPSSSALGLATVLFPRNAKQVGSICRELRLSNRDTSAVVWLTTHLQLALDQHSLELADLKELLASPHWHDLLWLVKGQLFATAEEPTAYHELIERADRIPPDEIAPPPLLTGCDLEAMDLTPGPLYGSVLRAVYRAQLNGELAQREEALELASKMIRQLSS